MGIEEFDTKEGLIDSSGRGDFGTGYLQILSEAVTGRKISDWIIQQSEPHTTMISHSEMEEQISVYLKGLFEGKRILDLGCGTQSAGFRIASFVGAKEYIGVEKNRAKTADENIKEDGPDIPYKIEQDDMLTFLEKAENNSFGVVFLVGIDWNIIPDIEYWKKLESQILRVLSENGYLLVGGSYLSYPEEVFKKDFTLDETYKDAVAKAGTSSPDLFLRKTRSL
ncbi:MAG: class I SAM-dependent methyltransferase [Candidatus Paceibacterota bacterium]|jgi:SAM-dependent methyltransferase